MRRPVLTVLLGIALAAGLVACGSAASLSPTSSPAGASASSPASAPASAPGSVPASAGGATGGSAGACATAPAGSTAATTVTIKNFAFNPTSVQAKVGDVIAWTNGDSAPHSATMDSGACDTDSISNGSTAMLVFTAAGTYTYHCKIHPTQMKDVTVVVQ